MKKEELTQTVLQELLSYEPQTGDFRWRYNAGGHGEIPAGSIAGREKNGGYRYIHVRGKAYLASHLAWLHVNGAWPPAGYEIDHINRDPRDNRISNLRLATKAQNGWNKNVQKNNTSGHKGVSWDSDRKKWLAVITFHRKQKPLGRFDRLEDAIEARRAAEILFHPQFAASSDVKVSEGALAEVLRDRSVPKMRSDNTSGHVGVSWSKQNKKWCASFRGPIGYFDTKEEAIAARVAAVKADAKSKQMVN